MGLKKVAYVLARTALATPHQRKPCHHRPELGQNITTRFILVQNFPFAANFDIYLRTAAISSRPYTNLKVAVSHSKYQMYEQVGNTQVTQGNTCWRPSGFPGGSRPPEMSNRG